MLQHLLQSVMVGKESFLCTRNAVGCVHVGDMERGEGEWESRWRKGVGRSGWPGEMEGRRERNGF